MSNRPCAKCGVDVDITEDEKVKAIVDAVGSPMCRACFDLWRIDNPPAEPPHVEPRKSKYQFTEEMDEISGFGGGYEQTCRNMVIAGAEWLDAHPDSSPEFKGIEGVYGICVEDNKDAKALSDAVVAAADGDCTGAMHQAAISHVLFIRREGWDRYTKEMIR